MLKFSELPLKPVILQWSSPSYNTSSWIPCHKLNDMTFLNLNFNMAVFQWWHIVTFFFLISCFHHFTNLFHVQVQFLRSLCSQTLWWNKKKKVKCIVFFFSAVKLFSVLKKWRYNTYKIPETCSDACIFLFVFIIKSSSVLVL